METLRTTQPSPEEIAKLPCPPINRFSFRATYRTLKAGAGFEDDDIDVEEFHAGKVVRFTFPFFQYKWIPPFAKWQKYLIPEWSGEWIDVTSADVVRELYTIGQDYIDEEVVKAYGFRFLLGGNSPFLLKGPEHVKVRRALIPELSQERVEAHREMSVRVMDRMIDQLPFNEPVSLTPLFEAFAQEMIIRFVFGLDDDDQPEINHLRDCLRRVMAYAYKSNWAILTNYLITGSFRQMQKRKDGVLRIYPKARRLEDEANGLLYGKIAQLRAHPNDSIASRLVARSESEPEFWTDKRLRDMLATLLVAGHDTSLSAYQWTLEYLLHNERPRARFIAEARRGESDRYARACTTEAIRLKPPFWGQFLLTKKDIALAGYKIRKGTFIFAKAHCVHSDPELYPDPLAFKPERWMDGQKPDRFGYLTFAAGTHRCPGTMFFGTESSIVFQRLFGRLDIDSYSRKLPRSFMDFGVFNRVHNPTPVYIRSRVAAEDVPWYKPSNAVEDSLDMLVDELVEGSGPDGTSGEPSVSSCPFAARTP